ncbi:hypothetical protein Tco_0353283 [Tanacetum coccineum]
MATNTLSMCGEDHDQAFPTYSPRERQQSPSLTYTTTATIRYGYSSIGRFDVFFRNQFLVFQQHQDESLYDSWTHFKDVILKFPNHGLSIWILIEIFLKHLDSLSRHIINLTAKGDLRKFSDIGAWYAIEYCAQYDKKCSNPTSAISDETVANPNAQIVGDDMVRVQVPRCMAWLIYDENVDSLSTMDNEIEVTSSELFVRSVLELVSLVCTLSSLDCVSTVQTAPDKKTGKKLVLSLNFRW